MSAIEELICSRYSSSTGQSPEFLAGDGEGVGEVLVGIVVVGEDAGVDLTERDGDGSGERGGVDEVGGAELLRA